MSFTKSSSKKRATVSLSRDRSGALAQVEVSLERHRGALPPAHVVKSFRSTVWKFWKEHRRDLPWRRTRNPYRIMVSEVMLQQTQVPRVIEKYREFLKEFPSVEALAKARLSAVLRVWSGLGYNRRGKYLHEAAKIVMREYGGKMPQGAEELAQLPGIGPYTARAIATFAYNTPSVFIETNIRAVFLHHFFPGKDGVHDTELLPLIEVAAAGQEPREWYAALMDYGSHLKQTQGNASRRSAHHKAPEKFKGSNREARGLVLKALQESALTEAELRKITSLTNERLTRSLIGLQKDGLIRRVRIHWAVA